MTYAAHDFARPEPLADMIARRERYERMADAFAINGDEANARIYEDEAAAEAARIGVRMRQHAAARIDHDRHDIPVLLLSEAETDGTGAIVWMLIGIMATVAVMVTLLWGIGSGHAQRPAGCDRLSALECTILAQEGAL